MPVRSPTHLIILAAALYREAWQALLSNQPDIVVAGVVADVSQLGALLKTGHSTTIFVDLPSPQPDLARQLRKVAPEAGLLFLIQSYEPGEVIPLLQAGATGCISPDDTVGDLARAIIAVGRGEIALPPHISGRALAQLAQGEPLAGDGLIEPLSERETEVLNLLAQGSTNKDIAQTLILSVRTVEAHLRNIFGKLGVHSRTEAAIWAVNHGYGPEQ